MYKTAMKKLNNNNSPLFSNESDLALSSISFHTSPLNSN